MTQRTEERPPITEADDTRDRRAVAEPTDTPDSHTRTPKPEPAPPYLPGYYLG
ncbi:hypothetical protein [Nocardioides silvaticus]|uniref:hypothetical protein n=1 Tax=Nocardioides silvaticus TaxID=2201891 RepID=UPI00130490C1|nr:hypothetical protein [Nocardioides silvaticus]